MPKYTENQIQNALLAIEAGMSIRSSASAHGVPYQTLRARKHGSVTRKEANYDNQRLSPTQENHLKKWALFQGSLGLPPTHCQLRNLAIAILKKSGDLKPLGKHWINGFIRRNPELKTMKCMPINKKRYNGATAERIQSFFEILQLPAV